MHADRHTSRRVYTMFWTLTLFRRELLGSVEEKYYLCGIKYKLLWQLQ